MLVKVKLHGTGKEKDPYRVNLPTYQLVHGNISQGHAIVFVPDDVHGLSDADLKDEKHEETTEGRLYSALSEGTLKKLHAHFDETYKEHSGEFRLEGA